MKKLNVFIHHIIIASLLLLPVSAMAGKEMDAMSMSDKDYVPSLITKTPYEGRQLAIKLARKSIGEMQSDSTVKKKVRAMYSEDGAILIDAAEVIAIEFATIAAANNYWR